MKSKKILISFLLILNVGCLSIGFLDAHTVPILTDGLIGYWACDENGGAVLIDSSGQNEHGSVVGSTWESGKYSYGLRYDGLNDYVNVTDLDLTGNFTIAGWFNVTDKVENYVISKWLSYHFRIDTNFILTVYSGSSAYYSSTSAEVPVNEWVHLVGVYNTTYGKIQLYINGTEAAYDHQDSISAELDVNDDNLILGKAQVDVHFYDGVMDDVRIYNRVLTNSEITYLYEGEPEPTPSPSPTVTPFPEGAMDDTDWWISVLLLAVVVLNIVLIAVPFALVRFVFACMAFLLSALCLSYQIPLSPYMQSMGMVVSVVCMFLAARARE